MRRILILSSLASVCWLMFLLCLIGFISTGDAWALIGTLVCGASTAYVQLKVLE